MQKPPLSEQQPVAHYRLSLQFEPFASLLSVVMHAAHTEVQSAPPQHSPRSKQSVLTAQLPLILFNLKCRCKRFPLTHSPRAHRTPLTNAETRALLQAKKDHAPPLSAVEVATLSYLNNDLNHNFPTPPTA